MKTFKLEIFVTIVLMKKTSCATDNLVCNELGGIIFAAAAGEEHDEADGFDLGCTKKIALKRDTEAC